MIDVTNGTNVNMGLGTLESSSQTTNSQLVASEDMVNGVDGARAQQGGAAGARQEVNGTGERHLCDMGSHKNNQTKKREMELGNTMVKLRGRINTQFSGQNRKNLSHPLATHSQSDAANCGGPLSLGVSYIRTYEQ